ncbi:hypothetical protein A4X13_0g8344 [Tilletia indica]|uniref:Uncharacterized protein n=1 Tax=Tilletia indica TaxID=43049 RepID=A0A8T8SFB3_9BASI|nr:hypothetical protein A4X13_0g8344 [Tilletia indica]
MVPDEAFPDPLASTGGDADAVDPSRVAVETGDTFLSSSSPSRLRICKPEYLPEYDGDPYKLDKFLTRVHDLIRNDPDPAWERAVLHALPIKLVDDAEEWHSGLSDDEIKAISSFNDLEEAMRLQFPMNSAEQRRLARERKWNPTIGRHLLLCQASRPPFGRRQEPSGRRSRSRHRRWPPRDVQGADSSSSHQRSPD